MSDAGMRVQKYLSRAGVASRRKAEELIRAGRVSVNGEPIRELGVRVRGGHDVVRVDGRVVVPAAPAWVVLNKPRGYVSTRRDPQRRRTLYHLLPAALHGLHHVGRLDIASEGLILLTNQGDVAQRLMHPRYGVERVYEVLLAGSLSAAQGRRLLTGVTLEGRRAQVLKVERGRTTRSGADRLRVTLREGRYREVRRLFEAVGHRVQRLRRVRYGPIELRGLRVGEWRHLSQTEIAALRDLAHDTP